jgi:phage baseplate assembly protein V
MSQAIQYGTIEDYKYETLGNGKKLLVKVLTDDRLTNWLPVKTRVSHFLKEHVPISKGDQVLVFNPFGYNEDGFVDCNLSYEDIPLPSDIDKDTFYQLFNDGTVLKHNTKTKTISLDTPCEISQITSNNINIQASIINIECKTNNLKAKKVNIDSSDIDLGLSGTGVQTNNSICNLTGCPCNNGSSTVKATM